ncbi:hypothetical protein WKH31_10610 [Metabacillus indicus]|uniref:hypothetical protein n=1 Tax=Metabacillus indicus TaxID=246786 RepID=UPI00317192C9
MSIKVKVNVKVNVKDINIVTATGGSFAANKLKVKEGGQISGNQGQNANQGGQIAGANGKNANQLSAIVDIGSQGDPGVLEPLAEQAAEVVAAAGPEDSPKPKLWQRWFEN